MLKAQPNLNSTAEPEHEMIGEEFDNLGVDYETLEDIELFGQIEEQRSEKIKSLERFATK